MTIKGGKASWAWSSILTGHDIVANEGFWVIIENEEPLKVFDNRWIPYMPRFGFIHATRSRIELSLDVGP